MKKLFLSMFLVLLGVIAFPSKIRAATYTVTKTADTNDGTCDADCSLREALASANANSGADTIAFNIPDTDGGYSSSNDDWTITLGSGLTISSNQSVTFDGTTQTGTTAIPTYGGKIIILSNTNITALTSNSGSDVSINHITFKSVSAAATPGFSFLGTTAALTIQNSYFTRDVQSAVNNYAIAPTATGNVNFSSNKIEYWNRGFRVTNTNSSASILIDANVLLVPESIGLFPDGYNITISNNVITGSSDQGVIPTCGGGTCTVSNNTITGGTSGSWSIRVGGAGTYSIANNTIDSGNNRSIYVTSAATVSNNSISGTYGSAAVGKIHVNTNDASKLVIVSGNTISVSNAIPIWVESANTRATVTNNSIVSELTYTPINVSGGTENSAFVNTNDSGDTDSGANDLMNFPVITKASYLYNNKYHVYGTLDGKTSEAPFTIEVCKSSESSSGYGGCTSSLGTTTVNSDGSWDLEVTVSGDDDSHHSSFSALATNVNGSTSEFSQTAATYATPVVVSAPTPAITFIGQGGAVTQNNVVSVVPANTFKYDAYFSAEPSIQTGAFKVPDTVYWQISPTYNLWWKAFFNNSKIVASELKKPFIVSLPYSTSKYAPNLSLNNLKLAYSTDGKRWKILTNVVINKQNKTIATVTKNGGYYMVVAGSGNINLPVLGKKTEIIATPEVMPTPTVEVVIPTLSPTPTSEPKHCFLFWCK